MNQETVPHVVIDRGGVIVYDIVTADGRHLPLRVDFVEMSYCLEAIKQQVGPELDFVRAAREQFMALNPDVREEDLPGLIVYRIAVMVMQAAAEAQKKMREELGLPELPLTEITSSASSMESM